MYVFSKFYHHYPQNDYYHHNNNHHFNHYYHHRYFISSYVQNIVFDMKQRTLKVLIKCSCKSVWVGWKCGSFGEKCRWQRHKFEQSEKHNQENSSPRFRLLGGRLFLDWFQLSLSLTLTDWHTIMKYTLTLTLEDKHRKSVKLTSQYLIPF